MASTQELGKLTDQVQKGTVRSARELDEAFARAHYALARYYQSKAPESWARKAVPEAGQDLKAAAVHLEKALNWASHRLEAGGVQTIREWKQIGEKMEKGAGWVDAEVRKAIEGIGKEIDETGHKIGFFK
jgi:hypothetical protein